MSDEWNVAGGQGRGRGRGYGRGRGTNQGAPGHSNTGRGRGNRGRGNRGRGNRQTQPSTSSAPVQQVRDMHLAGPSSSRGTGNRNNSSSGGPSRGPRGGHGNQANNGRELKLCTNYFKLNITKQQPVFQYHVTFEPEVASVSKKAGMVYNGIPDLANNVIFKDQTLYTCLDIGDFQEYSVDRQNRRNGNDEGLNGRNDDQEGDNGSVKVRLKKTDELRQDSPQFANVFFNYLADRYMNLTRVQRNYFNPEAKLQDLVSRYRLELWPGYQHRVGDYDAGSLMVVDTKFKILRTDTVREFIQDLYARRSNTTQADIRRHLVGCVVMTKYNNKTYRVDDINFDKKASDTVTLTGGREVSFLDYYRERYNITIRDHNQPILVHRQRIRDSGGNPLERMICLVPEVCFMTGLSDVQRANKRDPVLRELANVTRYSPADKVRRLEEFAALTHKNEAAAVCERWGVGVSKSLLPISGRNLPAEQIINSEKPIRVNTRRGEFDNITRTKFVLKTADVGSDCLIVCHKKDLQSALLFVEQPYGQSAGINIQFTRENIECVTSERAEAYITAAKNRHSRTPTRIILFILPDDRKDRYDAIKKQFCIDTAVLSQVVVARTLKKNGIASILTKILMQMEAKAGGQLWSTRIPGQFTMYVGIDTYHDTLTRGRSVGGFVASMNASLTRYYSRVSWQEPGQEILSNLQVLMTDALREYLVLNGRYPKRVLVFRDGVGRGQLEVVREQELASIKRALASYPERTELVFTVVTKRITTRFFEKTGSSYGNPPPGTVVDAGITQPRANEAEFDFYLVPQAVNQGTVSPTHYIVLEWDTKLRHTDLQGIAYQLCHLYFNWTGIISVPAVCQYAHKLAFLVGQSLHRDPSPLLEHYLYYL